MVWLLSVVLGLIIGLNSSVLLVTLVAALLGLAIAANALLTGMGLLQLPVEIVISAISFNVGLVVGLAGSLTLFRRR